MSGIMPLINVPDMVQYGRVTAHLVAFIADTLDDDDHVPDEIPLEGVVVLTPTVGVVRFPTTVPPRTAVVQALRCPIIGGDLYPPDTPLEGPLPDMPGVVVVASDQPVGLPDTVQWTATFELVGVRVQPSSVTFEVPSGGVVDLTTVIPATPTPGTVVVVSTEDRERAEVAADAAAADAATATAKAAAAASSASAAASSATAADDAMQAASQAASDADQSRVGAAASALAASVAEQGAVAAQDGLVVARDAAAGSASSAATSASEAVSSASSAATARSGAEVAAAEAKVDAATASAKATAAASSATAAATSATAAQTAAAALQDTGWRNIVSLLDPTKWGLPAAHPYLQVRRVGGRVTIRARLTAAAANPAGTLILTIPPGFRPVSAYNILGMGLLSDVLVAITNLAAPTSLSLRVAAAKDTWLAFEINFATDNPFPTPAEYPGTPA